MKIGIVADTHDYVENLETALKTLRAEGVTKIIHCGDVCGPEIARRLAEFEVWIAQGNMDRQLGLMQVVEETQGRGRLAWIHQLMLDGSSLAVIHGDNEELLANLIASGRFAYVFHGHTHRRRDQALGRTRVINPGALGGRLREGRSFCILELTTGEARFVELPWQKN
jgi:putative phosphoesterase